MDSKAFASYLKNNFAPILTKVGFNKKGNSFISVEREEILKGFVFDKSGDSLYVTWFVMPFIPVTYEIYFDVGERLVGKQETGDLFLLEEQNIETTTKELQKLISEKITLLQSINSCKDYYKFFYEENNWNKLNNLWLKSNLRHLERVLFVKAYLNLPFEKELKAFKKEWQNSDRKHVSWMQEIKREVDKLVEAKSRNKESIINLLDSMRNETIENLNLHKYP